MNLFHLLWGADVSRLSEIDAQFKKYMGWKYENRFYGISVGGWALGVWRRSKSERAERTASVTCANCPDCEGYRHNKIGFGNGGWCPTCCNSEGTPKVKVADTYRN